MGLIGQLGPVASTVTGFILTMNSTLPTRPSDRVRDTIVKTPMHPWKPSSIHRCRPASVQGSSSIAGSYQPMPHASRVPDSAARGRSPDRIGCLHNSAGGRHKHGESTCDSKRRGNGRMNRCAGLTSTALYLILGSNGQASSLPCGQLDTCKLSRGRASYQ